MILHLSTSEEYFLLFVDGLQLEADTHLFLIKEQVPHWKILDHSDKGFLKPGISSNFPKDLYKYTIRIFPHL